MNVYLLISYTLTHRLFLVFIIVPVGFFSFHSKSKLWIIWRLHTKRLRICCHHFSFVRFFTLISDTLMLLYRRRMFIYCFLFLLFIVQPLIYIFYSRCDNKVQIFLPDNITDKANIFNLNTRILCWIPTTLARLDRATVVHE